MRKALAAVAILCLAAHLPFLPATFDDLDGINFAMGVRDYDVAGHQPHPPGYPIFIALGKLSTAALSGFGAAAAPVRGLSLLSVVSVGLMVPALFLLFRALDGSRRRAFWATVLTMSAPLMWFTALRPLSDVPGLAAVTLAQALIVRAIRSPPAQGTLLAGAAAAGLAIGVRSQSFALTLPLLLVALLTPGVMRSMAARATAVAAFAAGALAWAVPLIVVSGGLIDYLQALGQQGGEDFDGVVMLWNFPTVRVGLSALRHTFLSPWGSIPLAVVVLLAATVGIVAVMRERRTAFLLAALALPYAAFHLLFHETITVRYALPLVPAISWLAVRGIERSSASALPVAVAALVAWSLTVGIPASVRYGTSPSPIFNALGDLSRASDSAGITVATHRRLFTESRRARSWLEPPGAWLPAPRDFEWLELTRAWRAGAADKGWFFADPRRTDLALIDSHGATVVPYRWPFDHTLLVGGARPGEFDVHAYDKPGWFLEEGWALTPETAGIAAREGWQPHLRPSIGWIRRHDGPATMVLGGRHLGAGGSAPMRIVATLDERVIVEREVSPGFFTHNVELPPGALTGEGTYAALQVRALASTGDAAPVALEQFNVQRDGVPMIAYGSGWHEPEYKPDTALSWRWVSRRGELWVRPVGRDVVLTISGESPLRYFDGAPVVRLSVSGRELSRISPEDDFTWEVTIPEDLLAAADGTVVIESDLAFVPGGATGGDQRQLALRIYRINVR